MTEDTSGDGAEFGGDHDESYRAAAQQLTDDLDTLRGHVEADRLVGLEMDRDIATSDITSWLHGPIGARIDGERVEWRVDTPDGEFTLVKKTPGYTDGGRRRE